MYGFRKYAPKASPGTEVEDAATLPSFLGDKHLLHGANVILSAKEELQHLVLELGALGGVRRARVGGRWAHSGLLIVCGEHVALAEGIETPPV